MSNVNKETRRPTQRSQLAAVFIVLLVVLTTTGLVQSSHASIHSHRHYSTYSRLQKIQRRAPQQAYTTSSKHHHLDSSILLKLRGGGDEGSSSTSDSSSSSSTATAATMTAIVQSSIIDKIQNMLLDGPQGVVGLYIVSFVTVFMFTMIRASYAFTLGYAGTIFMISMALMKTFDTPGLTKTEKKLPALLANASLLYGIRLFAYLYFRNLTVPSKAKSIQSVDTTPIVKRIILALNVSLLYAFMTTPVLYALRGGGGGGGGGSNNIMVERAGVILAYVGLAIETMSDAHKYITKKKENAEYGGKKFVGPVSGTFLLCRHPSYFGEVLFWFGLFLGGSVYFGKSITAWVCSTLGLAGIYFVMSSASKRLDKKQLDTYKGQGMYDKWRGTVKGALFPSF